MELLRILFLFGFLTAACSAMEIQPPVLPRNFAFYCKLCDGIHNIFDNFSYDDYDFWRTFYIQDKIKFFCSFCKKKTESTTLPTTELTPEMTTSEFIRTTPQPDTQGTSTPETTTSSPETTNSSPETTTSSTETPSSSPETTTLSTETTSSSTETTTLSTETTSSSTETTTEATPPPSG